MFRKIKALIHEVIDFLNSGESGAIKDRNGRIVGVYDGGPYAWSIVRLFFLFQILPMLIIDVFTRKNHKNIKRNRRRFMYVIQVIEYLHKLKA